MPGPAEQRFGDADLDALKTIASSLALALSNLNLAAKLVADKMLKRDIAQAQIVQNALLSVAHKTNFAAGYSAPAQELSGDFFNYKDVGDQVAFCIGDVSGKGIAAALMMTRMITLFRYLVNNDEPLERIVVVLNDAVLGNVAGQFVTAIIGRYDKRRDSGQMINCGHIPALWMADSASIIYPASLTPLGVVPFSDVGDAFRTFRLKQGWLVLTTDGITESQTGAGNLDGPDLVAFFHKLSGQSAAEKLASFAADFEKPHHHTHDDATILVLARPSHE